MRLILLLLLTVISTGAQTPVPALKVGAGNRIGWYVKTHKSLLVSDAILVMGAAADAASTQHCINASILCHEGNPLVGTQRPSAIQSWSFSLVPTAFVIFAEHMAVRQERQKGNEWNAFWIGTGINAAIRTATVKHNVDLTEWFQANQPHLNGCVTAPRLCR